MKTLETVEREIETEFLRLLDITEVQGMRVSGQYASRYFAPKVFSRESKKYNREAFEKAMERLFACGVIEHIEYGPPSAVIWRIERALPARS